jgi:hypothetical protein
MTVRFRSWKLWLVLVRKVIVNTLFKCNLSSSEKYYRMSVLWRIRILLFTFMRTQIRILPFTLIRIRIQILPFTLMLIRILLVTLMRIRLQLFTLMRIRKRIQLPKMMRIRIRNTGARVPVCPVPDPQHCNFFPLGFHLTTKIFPPYVDVMM